MSDDLFAALGWVWLAAGVAVQLVVLELMLRSIAGRYRTPQGPSPADHQHRRPAL